MLEVHSGFILLGTQAKKTIISCNKQNGKKSDWQERRTIMGKVKVMSRKWLAVKQMQSGKLLFVCFTLDSEIDPVLRESAAV